MREKIFWTIVFGFLFGIFMRSHIAFGWASISGLMLCSAALFAGTRSAPAHARAGAIAAAALLAIALGVARMHVAVIESEPLLDARVGEKVELEGVVADEPDMRENNVRIRVRVSAVASEPVVRGASVLAIAPLHTDARYGDVVRAEGTLRLPRAFEAGEGREFDYPGYLAKDGILYELSFASVEVTGSARKNPLKVFAIAAKRAYLDGLAMALPEPQAGLAGGITAGDKRGLGSELSETFRIVGLIHIVVLSGYNIMIVISFVERLFGWTRLWVRSSLGVLIAVFFALLTGLASSSVRAASMAVIATAGKATGRTYLASRALGVVAIGMVVWNPYVLAFDPGFQLSILATLGLIFISPLIASRLGWLTERFGLREIAAATLGTQAAVVPLILYQSGTLSVYSLPANLLALLLVPHAMLLSFITGVLGTFTGPLAPVFGFPAYVLLSYITAVARFFAWLPLSAMTVPAFSAPLLFASYAALVIAYRRLKKRTAGP